MYNMENNENIKEMYDGEEWPDMYEELSKFYQEKCEGYKTLISFLLDQGIHNKDGILESISEGEFKVFGKVQGEWRVKDGNLFVVANVPSIDCINGIETCTITAEWQHSDNYAVKQWTDFEDDYKGYLLIPAYNMKDFLCVYFWC